jgi:hypothetical protein
MTLENRRSRLYIRATVTWVVLVVLTFVSGIVLDVHTGNDILIVAAFVEIGVTVVATCTLALVWVW